MTEHEKHILFSLLVFNQGYLRFNDTNLKFGIMIIKKALLNFVIWPSVYYQTKISNF